jgi:uncharacterized protein YhbP (UPF0306 family)
MNTPDLLDPELFEPELFELELFELELLGSGRAAASTEPGPGPAADPDPAAVRSGLGALLGAVRLLALATVGPDGTPWANSLYYVHDRRLRLHFLTDPRSRHGRNLRGLPTVAAAVADSEQPGAPGTRRGLQLSGTCRPTDDAGLRPAADLFTTRFPHFAAGVGAALAGNGPLRLYTLTVNGFTVFDEPRFGRDTSVRGRIRDRGQL